MRIVVIGCTHAGTAAVREALTVDKNAIIDVYERRTDIAFLSCGISLYLEGTVPTLEEMMYDSPAALEALGPNVHVHMQHDVLSIDATQKTVDVENLATGTAYTESYDKLILATGSYPVVPPIQGVGIPKVFLCKNADDARAIKEASADAKSIAIVGGGYIGVELAESLSSVGHEIVFINGVHDFLSSYVDNVISERVEKELNDHGVLTHMHERALKFDSDADGVYVQTDKGERFADIAIVCVGFRPMSELLEGQVQMMANGAVHVNEYLQTSDPDIYAAGDVVAIHFNPTGQDAYAPLATNAIRQGRIAGRNIFGNRMRYLGTQSTSALKIYQYTMTATGLTEAKAQKAGFNAGSVTIEDHYRPEFMPSNQEILMTLVYDADNRQILGAQFFSALDTTQSANLISVMIQNKNTIDDLAFVDMLFNPHYDKPWNYLNLLGQAAMTQADAAEAEGKEA